MSYSSSIILGKIIFFPLASCKFMIHESCHFQHRNYYAQSKFVILLTMIDLNIINLIKMLVIWRVFHVTKYIYSSSGNIHLVAKVYSFWHVKKGVRLRRTSHLRRCSIVTYISVFSAFEHFTFQVRF